MTIQDIKIKGLEQRIEKYIEEVLNKFARVFLISIKRKMALHGKEEGMEKYVGRWTYDISDDEVIFMNHPHAIVLKRNKKKFLKYNHDKVEKARVGNTVFYELKKDTEKSNKILKELKKLEHLKTIETDKEKIKKINDDISELRHKLQEISVKKKERISKKSRHQQHSKFFKKHEDPEQKYVILVEESLQYAFDYIRKLIS